MEEIVLALIPIFLLIALGYYFKKIQFPDKDFWSSADKLTYFVLFPSLLIYNLATANLENIKSFSFVLSGIITLILMSVITILLNKLFFKFENASFTSVFQGAIRFNTYVFFAVVSAILGDEGLVLAALFITFLVPLVNVFCIGVFSFYTNSSTVSVKSFLKSIAQNPLILACLIGGSINFFNIPLPSFTIKTLGILSEAALPLGLLSVGVGLHIKAIGDVKVEITVSSLLKLVLFPVLIYFVASFFDLSSLALSVLLIYAAMPTASSAYILARQLGGNLSLMSALITIQTLASIVTIFAILSFLK